MYYLWTIVSMIILVGLDFISKQVVMNNMQLYQTIEVIPNVFHLYYDTNPGIALSLLEHQRWLFIPVSILITVLCIIILYRSPLRKHRVFSVVFVLIISGAIGNLIDRIFYGEVVDFLVIKFIRFPYTFNVADCYVVVATFLLAFLLLFKFKQYEETPLRTLLFNIPAKKKESNNG